MFASNALVSPFVRASCAAKTRANKTTRRSTPTYAAKREVVAQRVEHEVRNAREDDGERDRAIDRTTMRTTGDGGDDQNRENRMKWNSFCSFARRERVEDVRACDVGARARARIDRSR